MRENQPSLLFLLRDKLGISEFVNADTIAQGLSAYSPEKVAIPAGKIMLKRINKLSESGKNFAFETTLLTRTFAPKLKKMSNDGYEISLFFMWLISQELAVLRVSERVKQGNTYRERKSPKLSSVPFVKPSKATNVRETHSQSGKTEKPFGLKQIKSRNLCGI